MKLGFNNKRELALMVLVVSLAVYLGARYLFFQPTPTVVATKAANAAPRPMLNRDRRRWVLPKDLKPSLDPSLKFELLKASEEKEYAGGKRNIFREYVEPAKIEPPKEPVIVPKPVDTGPPPPPPINLKYYGYANKPGEPRKVFLSSGDEVFIAEEGQIVQRRYKVLKISGTSVEVEDVLNNNRQTIPLTQG